MTTRGVHHVLDALERTVADLLPDELARLAAVEGIALPPPARLEQLADPVSLIDATVQFPAIAFTSPGLADAPSRVSPGVWDVTWSVLVTVMVRGGSGTYRSTARAVSLYTQAIRQVVMRTPRLGGIAEWSLWTDEDYSAYGSETARTLGAGFVEFAVHVPGALNSAPPIAAPFTPDGPLIETTTLTASRKDQP